LECGDNERSEAAPLCIFAVKRSAAASVFGFGASVFLWGGRFLVWFYFLSSVAIFAE
jgi:hypothetical protein